MKKETGNYIFQLLKAFIFDEKPVLTGDPDWDEILYYARIHAVSGMISYVITKYHLCNDPEQAGKFEFEMIQTYGYQYRRSAQMKKLIGMLNDLQIDHLLMKGYVIKDLYPVPELRSYGDIDFVIRKEDRPKSEQLMKELNFEVHDNWEPVYSYTKDTQYYEIHTELLDSEINNGKQREYFHDFWNHAKKIGNHSYVLDEEYHFLYLISHLAKHASRRGAGVRMYLDIAIYIMHYKASLNWSHVLEQLEVLNLKQFFYTVCTLCRQWFDVEPPCLIGSIDQKAIEEFTEITLNGGIFGFNESNEAITAVKESHDHESKYITILNQLFPPVKEMKARYTYLQKHRWLYPIALIDRIIRNRNLINNRVHLAKDIIRLDDNEIDRMNNLNKKIGL